MFNANIPIQVLQIFHRARPHHDSPIKTSQLNAARGRMKRPLSYDPRPSHLRNLTGYPAYVRNLVVNVQVFVNADVCVA